MKFELKTENDNYSKSFLNFLNILIKLVLIIIFCNVVLKLGIITKHYQIEFNCKLLSIEKSKLNFKKLSKLSNLKSKQKILELCRDFVK